MKQVSFFDKTLRSGKGILTLGALAVIFIGVSCTGAKNVSQNQKSPEELEAARLAQEQQNKEAMTHEMTVAYNLGDDMYRQKNYETALSYFWQTNNLDKELNNENLRYPRIYQKIANSYLERGLLDSTYYAYTDGLKYDPQNLNYLRWIQWYHFKNQSLDEFISFTENILDIMKTKGEGLNGQVTYLRNLKDLYINRGEYEKAMEKIELLMEIDPGNREQLDFERINMIRNIGGDEALQKEFEKQHMENPTDSDIIWNLLKTYEDQGLEDKVLEFVEKYIALKPDDIDARLKKIEALKATSKIDEALVALNEISSLRPNDPAYIVDIAKIYHIEKEDLRQAMQWAVKARGVNPNFGPANLLMATIITEVISDAMERKELTIPDYDDKLAGEIAVYYFNEALKDANTRSSAESLGKFYQENYTRNFEDRFMKKGVEKPEHTPEYDWILKYKK